MTFVGMRVKARNEKERERKPKDSFKDQPPKKKPRAGTVATPDMEKLLIY